MYYSNQFRPRNKEESSGILKTLPRQLGVVFALMLVMILLSYTGSETGKAASAKVKSFFYMDMTKKADEVFAGFKGRIESVIGQEKEKQEDQKNEEENPPSAEETPASSIVFGCNPISGAVNITSPFGARTSPIDSKEEIHTGVDIEAPVNTPVMVVMDGTVAEWKSDENYGLTVLIDHGNGCTTRYAHLSRLVDEGLEPGEVVEKGSIIAYSGESGKVTGPHLHFEVMMDGKVVDPAPYLAVSGNV